MDTKKEEKNTQYNPPIMYCNICDHLSCEETEYAKHLLSAKHKQSKKKILKNTQNEQSDPQPKFSCECCNYSTCDKYNWNRHLATASHLASFEKKKRGKSQESVIIPFENKFQCDTCSKKFKYRTGVYKHKKKCIPSSNIPILDAVQNTSEFQTFMIEHTKELHQFIIEQNKTIIELSNKTNIHQTTTTNTTNTINNNNKFNLNVFLNETCKDAMNITEFMKSLQYKLSDLENTCDLGYAEGISRILIRGLKDMDVCKRPIHCSDLKRETIYLKVTNGWEKENESKEKLRKMIGTIANNNINLMPKWIEMHPDCKVWNNKHNTRYVNLVNASMGGADKEEDEKFMNKIIHNVVKEVAIEK